MNIRTKVITTIIAMVCSLSVSATGIIAIMLDFPVQVANTTSLSLGEIQGNLYGERYGANNQDLVLQHLYKSGVGVQEAEMNFFCQDVSFSSGSTKMEYKFKFILDGTAENGVLVSLTDGSLSNNITYTATYQYGYGQAEPDWSTANHSQVGVSHVVSPEQPYIWLRATLEINLDAIARIDTEATWSFGYSFTGISVEG